MTKDLTKFYKELELAKPGYANGISTFLYKKQQETGDYTVSLSDEEKQKIKEEAALHYGKFLDALGVDWKNDPNSDNTPMRVAKSYVDDLWAGRYNAPPKITQFPSDGYDGIVLEKNIPFVSMCSHHHQNIIGRVHIAYVSSSNGEVVGLSKLNRIVDHITRRGQIQEAMTKSIHHAVDEMIPGNEGVMVIVDSNHQCISCRNVVPSADFNTSMVTSSVSGVFADHTKTVKQEVMQLIKNG